MKRVKPLAWILGLLLSVATFAQQSADGIRRPGLAAFAHYSGGLMKSEEGDFNGAIAEFNHLIELNPRDAGMKRLFAGDKKAAADCFDKRLGTQENTFDEYLLARAELKSLEKTH